MISPLKDRQPLRISLSPRTIGSSLRRFWRWATLIHTDDPVRQVLNQGFASILIFFIFICVWLGLALSASGESAATLVAFVGIPVLILMWWLNRRGTVYGASLYVPSAIVGIIL